MASPTIFGDAIAPEPVGGVSLDVI